MQKLFYTSVFAIAIIGGLFVNVSVQNNPSISLDLPKVYAWNDSVGDGSGTGCCGGSSDDWRSDWRNEVFNSNGNSNNSTNNTNTHTNTYTHVVTPSCSLTGSPTSITDAGSSTLIWSSSNATSATLSSVGAVAVSGSRSVAPNVTTTYTLTVKSSTGHSATCATTIRVTVTPQAPTCTLNANSDHITQGGTSMLSWTTQRATSASISTIGSVALSGSYSVMPASSITYTMTVTGAGGTATCSKTVTVTPTQHTAPSCTLSASPDSITYGGSTTLSWNSSNATSASMSTIGSVALSGSYSIAPSVTTTYILTVSGQGGTTTCQRTVTVSTVQHTTPSCTMNVSPSSVQQGSPVTVSWNSTNATSATLSSTGSVALSGSQTFYPNSTTTYTLTVYGNGGSNTCSQTVGVTSTPVYNYDVPYCTISTTQYGVQSGSSVTLFWSSTNAHSASLDMVGSVQTNGSYTIPNVTQSRSYTLTVTGPGGTRTCVASVTVQPPQYYTGYVPPTPVYVPPTNVHYGAPFGDTPVRYVSPVRLSNLPYTGAEDYILPFFILAFILSAGYMGMKTGVRLAR
jgi:hypothetical protein